MQLCIRLQESVRRIDQGRFFRAWDLVTGPESNWGARWWEPRVEERRGCLPKSNCQVKRLEFIFLLGGLWRGIRDRLGQSGQGNRRRWYWQVLDLGTKQQKYQAYDEMRKIFSHMQPVTAVCVLQTSVCEPPAMALPCPFTFICLLGSW